MPILNIEAHAKKYIAFIKTKKCTACFREPVDADHLITIGMGNNRKNNTERDFTCVPLCRKCHTQRGQESNDIFQIKHRVNLWKDAHKYLMEYLLQEH